MDSTPNWGQTKGPLSGEGKPSPTPSPRKAPTPTRRTMEARGSELSFLGAPEGARGGLWGPVSLRLDAAALCRCSLGRRQRPGPRAAYCRSWGPRPRLFPLCPFSHSLGHTLRRTVRIRSTLTVCLDTVSTVFPVSPHLFPPVQHHFCHRDPSRRPHERHPEHPQHPPRHFPNTRFQPRKMTENTLWLENSVVSPRVGLPSPEDPPDAAHADLVI